MSPNPRVLAVALLGALCPLSAAVSVTVSPTSVTLIHGQSQQFSATVVGAVSPAVFWSINPTIGSISNSGLYTAPASIFQNFTITVTATSLADTSKVGTATVYLVPTVGISISPTSVTLTDGQSQKFNATVTGTQNTAVTWRISPPGAGTITNDGLYTAPAAISNKQTVSVIVASVADPTQVAQATVNLSPFVPVSISVNPATATLRAGQTEQFTATVTGLPNTLVIWSISPQAGTISNTGFYTAPAVINVTQTVTVTAVSMADPARSASAIVTLLPAAITVSPTSATLNAFGSQQFTALSSGVAITDVTWTISPGYLGSITATGLYTAPSFVTAKQTVTVSATSIADRNRFGSATVTLNASSIAVSPPTAALTNSQTQQFLFVVDGTPSNAVNWTLSPLIGSISASGFYTAPAIIGSTQTVTLTGTAVDDATKFARATITLSPFSDVGVGSPNGTIQQYFIDAYYRNGFNNLVSLPPTGNVRKLGTTGLVQEFPDANKTSGVRFALVKPNLSTAPPANEDQLVVFQMYGDVYAYFNSVGVATAGYPTIDSQNCAFWDTNNSCTYQFFDRNYALFAYKAALYSGQNFTIRNLFYTKWVALGGISGPGRPIDVETTVTSSAKTTATTQVYASGAIYSITSGAQNGKVYGVIQPIYGQYVSSGGSSGTLGFPISDEIVLATGLHRQTFENGKIEYAPGTDPGIKLPVESVRLAASGTGQINVGDTLLVTASVYSASGALLPDRAVSWITSNSQVVTIQANGQTAVIKGVGGGSANVTAACEGKTSSPLPIVVTSQCCQVGEGAPTPAVRQAFADAVTRNGLKVLLPAANPVQRMGTGYVQRLQSADPNNPARYLLAKSDRLPAAYLVTGNILARYEQLGGPAGTLGHPTGDASEGGTQVFEHNAALGGSPVRLVSGVILSKWTALGYDGGAAGPPLSEAAPFLTFGANSGFQQAFRGGVIYGAVSGPRAGQAFFVSGLILDRFNALGGPGGAFGMPTSEEFASDNVRRQNFEGGYIDYTAGDDAAKEHSAERNPAVTAAPAIVVAGTRVRLAVSGFPAGSTIRVSITGQQDFLVSTDTGAYSWDTYIPLTARSGTFQIQAADVGGTSAAEGSYTVKSLAENRVQFTKIQGDGQTGLPGAQLAQKLRAGLRDQSGNPVIGAPVIFQASPGAQIAPTIIATDQNGQAEAVLRLPLTEGSVLATADSPGIALAPTTFSARAASSTLNAFPKLMQASDAPIGNGTATLAQKGALLTAVASILRYHQNRGELLQFNGAADPGTLNQFLTRFCAVDASGGQICDGFLVNPDSGEQVVNLWRAGEFVSGGIDVSVEKPDLDVVRDVLGLGSPVLLALSLQADGAPAGGHYVVATGIAPDGGILIHDPNPSFARTTLGDYLAGFQTGINTWKGVLKSAVRFLLQPPGATRFLVSAVSQPGGLLQNLAMEVKSIAGACGRPADLPDAQVFGAAPPATPLVSRFVACDGGQGVYQLNAGTSQPYRLTLTDLSAGGAATDLSGNSAAAYKLTRPQLRLVVAPQDASVSEVVNGATHTEGIAPGGLMAIFGAGLAGPGRDTTVEVDGVAAELVMASPFQVTAQVPPDAAASSCTLRVTSPYGTVDQPVEIRQVAPVILPAAGLTNQDGSVNRPTAPARRGQSLIAYGTGFGNTTKQGSFSVISEPVQAVLSGVEMPVSFAGLTPGIVGMYQVNVSIPAATPPGIDLPLFVRQAGVESNTVLVSIQ